MSEWFADLKADFILNFVQENRWKFLATGLRNTLIITFLSVLIGVVLGIIVAIIKSSYDKTYKEINSRFKKFIFKIINAFCDVYLTVIRGTPIVVQLMIMYYIIFASSRNSLMVAVIAFGINSGAYVAEIVRSGIMSIDPGQFEAGRSLGFGYPQTMLYIILPQAFKNILPALANEFIVLLKETSVAGYVTIRDLTMGGNIIRAATYSAFMPLVAVAVIYLVMVIVFTKLVNILERRLRKSER
ncbi:MAG: amino acid ABC transporter permease [Clostridia bacterium]|nr:amino acid ABC transporter permease [Clostridia bacterium]